MLRLLEDSKPMLIKLLPDQISKFWNVISYAVEQSLPPVAGEHPDKMNRVLSAALSGKVDVWASYSRNEDSVKFEGVVLTKFLYDDVSDTRNLLIYCLYGYREAGSDSWTDGLDSLLKYAKSRNCTQIVAYTDLPAIIRFANRLGAQSKYTFLAFDVDQTTNKFHDLGGE